jgi:ribosome maturation factor RimP
VVRLVIHSPRGISHGDCERVTKRAGDILDSGALGSGSYVLEVSSPGLDRVLKNEREFDLFRGRKMRVRLEDSPEREIIGWSEGTREGHRVVLRGEKGDECVLSWSSVARARLDPDLPGPKRREDKS